MRRVEGVGIHTGASVAVTLEPSAPAEGIVFVRGPVKIPARPEFVSDTSRCTTLTADGASVSTVEHLMSALAGLGISGARITVDGPELPILDGSALGWINVLEKQEFPRTSSIETRQITEPILLKGQNGSFIAVYPAEKLSVTVGISFAHPLVGTQVARFVEGDDYSNQVAPARTFGFIEEVQQLREAGLAKGGSLENAVIVYPDRFEPALRFENELARHKLLDLLGDLYLSGNLPKADIIAVKPSHTLNVTLASRLYQGR